MVQLKEISEQEYCTIENTAQLNVQPKKTVHN